MALCVLAPFASMVALRRLDSLDSLWEMERYLVHHGYRSSYSIQDLEAELDVLDP